MAPLDFTVDYNDATLETAGSAATPEVSLSNRTTQVDIASLAVLGAGSDAVELYFEFDDIGTDTNSDGDLSILSDDSGGDRLLRVDTTATQGSFKFSKIDGDSFQNGATSPDNIYDSVNYTGVAGAAALGVTDAFLNTINNPATNPTVAAGLESDSIVHAGAVSGATAVLSLGVANNGNLDLNSGSPQTFQVYKAIYQDQSQGHFVTLNMGQSTQGSGELSIALLPVSKDANSGIWDADVKNDGWIYTGRGGELRTVKAVEKVWIDLDAIGLTFGPPEDPQTNAQEVITGEDGFGVELVGDGVSTVDIGGLGTAEKFGINVNDDLTVLGASEVKLNEGKKRKKKGKRKKEKEEK
jgi:hypothetical protein